MANIETTDIFRGTFYLCMGNDLIDIRFSDSNSGKQTATFFFSGSDLHRHDQAYVNGHALVNPVQFRTALNHLRDILFEKLRKQNPNTRIGRYENDRKRAHRGHQNHC